MVVLVTSEGIVIENDCNNLQIMQNQLQQKYNVFVN